MPVAEGEGLVTVPKTVKGLEKTAAGLGGCLARRVWFPQVIGAVCGSHVAVRSFVEDGPVLFNCKSSHVPAFCDHMGRFPDVLSGDPASKIALWCKQPFLAKPVL